MSEAELMRCNLTCGNYRDHKSRPFCLYGGGFYQVKKNGRCKFGLTRTTQETPENSQLEQSVQQAPWMRTDNGEVSPAPRPDGH